MSKRGKQSEDLSLPAQERRTRIAQLLKEAAHGRKSVEYSVLRDPFLQAMAAELFEAEQMHPPFNSVHEAYAVILEEVDELWEEVRKKKGLCSAARIREELVQIAAMAWRAARDLGTNDGCLTGDAYPGPHGDLTLDLDPEVLYEQQKERTDGRADWDRVDGCHLESGDRL